MSNIISKDKDIDRYFWPKGQSVSIREESLAAYERALGFSREQLIGKTVLDLGSGATNRFARELEQAGIDVDVVSLNPDLSRPSYLESMSKNNSFQRKLKNVAGIAQQLPFKDEVFDMIVGFRSVTYNAETERDIKSWVSEIKRTLKSRGEARISPVLDHGEGRTTWLIKNIAENIGLSFSVVFEDSGNHYYILSKP